MTALADLTLFDRHDRLVGLVEVFSILGTAEEWATGTRRNLLAHGDYPADTFFLIVTPDRLYLWDRGKGSSAGAPPDLVVDSGPILEPYFRASRIEPASVTGFAFEMVVWSWFSDLTREGKNGAGRHLLEATGLAAAVRNGHVEYADAA